MKGQGLGKLVGEFIGQVIHAFLLLVGQGFGQVRQGGIGFIEGGSHLLAHDGPDRCVDALCETAGRQILGQPGKGLDLFSHFLPIAQHLTNQDGHPGHVHENRKAGCQGQAKLVLFSFQVSGCLDAIPEQDEGRGQAQDHESQARPQDRQLQLTIGIKEEAGDGPQGGRPKGKKGVKAPQGFDPATGVEVQRRQDRPRIGQEPPLIMQVGDPGKALPQAVQVRSGQPVLDGVGGPPCLQGGLRQKLNSLLGQGPGPGQNAPDFHKAGQAYPQEAEGKNSGKGCD